MHTRAKRWLVVLGVGLLLAAEPVPPQPSVPPSNPIVQPGRVPVAEQGPQLGESTLPTPRPLPPGAPVEEPAPAPREISSAPGAMVPPLTPTPLPQGERGFNPPVAPSGERIVPAPLAPGGGDGLGVRGSITLPPMPREEAAPMPRTQTPAPPQLFHPSMLQPAPLEEVRLLHQETEGLRLECEAMLQEETALRTALDLRGSKEDDAAQLRRRISDLLTKVAQQQASKPQPPANGKAAPPSTSRPPDSPANTKPAKSSGEPPHPLPVPKQTTPTTTKPAKQPDHSERVLTDAPVDPQTLAMTLFLAGEHEAALQVYRKLEQEEPKVEDRITIQYMSACCLRKLGKLDEAAVLYREVANSGGNEILVENAQWYLRAMKERRELETQLDGLRQRRQALTPKKP